MQLMARERFLCPCPNSLMRFGGPHETGAPALRIGQARGMQFMVPFSANVAFSRGTGWRGLCPAQTVTDRTVGYNAWLD